MNYKKTSLMITFIMTLGLLNACQHNAVQVDPALTVSISDFTGLSEQKWKGKLTYLDYSSKQMASVSVLAEFEVKAPRTIKYKISYPAEPYMNSSETLRISRQGNALDGHDIIALERRQDSIKVVTEHEGSDNDLSATIRTRYFLNKQTFSITKEVKYTNSSAFFERNKFVLTH